MKVVVVGPTAPFRGGISHYTTLLVAALRRRHSVFFASFSRQYPAWLYPGESDRDPSSSLVREKPDHLFDAVDLSEWRTLGDVVEEAAPDLVVLPWTVAYWAPSFLVFLQRLRSGRRSPRVLFLCHNVVEHEASAWKSWLAGRTLAMGDLFVTHSRPEADRLLEVVPGCDATQLSVSPHPEYRHLRGATVDQEGARRRLGLPGGPTLLFFGFVRKYKGLETLLESLPIIRKEIDAHLVVAGEFWDGVAATERRIRELDLGEVIRLLPRYIPNEEVADLFAAADLVVAPYLSATQSGIVQLAFGFEKPVVASNVGGLPEAIRHGQTGLLVPPGDPAALAAAIVGFFQSGQGPVMVEAIRGKREVFSWERMVETIESLANRSGVVFPVVPCADDRDDRPFRRETALGC
jgi:glycosyltransferase involved in cell wall biosynthesis